MEDIVINDLSACEISDFFPIFAIVFALNLNRIQNMLNDNAILSLEKIRTPFYLYDMELLAETVSEVVRLSGQYGIEVHYAVKANADDRILRYIASRGLGADCVSGNEVLRAIGSGFPAEKIAFAGVGKTDEEIETAVRNGIFSINCESLPEIETVDLIASRLGLRARVSARINPNIDAHTHKYITTGLEENKFGISEHDLDALIRLIRNSKSIDFNGLHFHVGSQILDVEQVFSLECRRANEIVSYFEKEGVAIDNIDLGGGLGIDYADPAAHPVPDFRTWFSTIAATIRTRPGRKIHVEPGRSIVAQCGILCTKVLFVKRGEKKTFLITDAGMNDLIRPALYGARHKVVNLSARLRQDVAEQVYDVVGPVCESSDVWGEGLRLPESSRGDLLGICSAGAYGQVMASRYNLRDLAPSVYIPSGDTVD